MHPIILGRVEVDFIRSILNEKHFDEVYVCKLQFANKSKGLLLELMDKSHVDLVAILPFVITTDKTVYENLMKLKLKTLGRIESSFIHGLIEEIYAKIRENKDLAYTLTLRKDTIYVKEKGKKTIDKIPVEINGEGAKIFPLIYKNPTVAYDVSVKPLSKVLKLLDKRDIEIELAFDTLKIIFNDHIDEAYVEMTANVIALTIGEQINRVKIHVFPILRKMLKTFPRISYLNSIVMIVENNMPVTIFRPLDTTTLMYMLAPIIKDQEEE